MDVGYYFSRSGFGPYVAWLDALEDQAGRIIIKRRIARLERNLLGDCRFCAEGVWELRVDFGPGYRIYFAKPEPNTVLVLRGGSKRTQPKDIALAVTYWKDFKSRQPWLQQ